MPFESKKSRVALFFAIGLGLGLLMAALKAAIALATHTYLYSVPWVGGFLKSIELTEISNLLVFAILGAGIGAATALLPRRWDHRAKLAVLLAVSPFVFCASYMMQQNLWIQQVAATSNLSYRNARDLTNDYLTREVGSGGFFGFYPFSTQLAELPVQAESLRSEGSLNPNELLSEELSSYNDPRADFAAYVFERVGWLIRFMYMALAALTAIIYYFKGHAWAENRPQPSASAPLNAASTKANTKQGASATPAITPASRNKGKPSRKATKTPVSYPNNQSQQQQQPKRLPNPSRQKPSNSPLNAASRKDNSRGLQARHLPEPAPDKPDTAASPPSAIPPIKPEDV
ncbi:MAG: hypothetical protein WA984_09620 [Phormidesmis sp.]